MDMLIEDISQCCIKVYTLEKVLKRKKDAVTQVDFLTEAMKVWRRVEAGYGNTLRCFVSATGREAVVHILDDTCDLLRYTSSLGGERQVALESVLVVPLMPFRSANNFISQSFSTGYPKLLRLFHDFFAKIAIHTDTVYSQEYQR
jgi:hypothetical protein